MPHPIQEIFKRAYSAYEKKRQLPQHVLEAAHKIISCRTALLGGHLQSCPDSHFHRVWYNSCKHRMCPQCSFIRIQEWLEKQKARILNCDHYHVIFTIPQELRVVWHANSKLLTGILFTCARDTIFELLEDPKRIGGKPGIIAALHTWTKTLVLHPHIHCLVTGGGLSPSNLWIPLKGSYLFPYAAARAKFRSKVRAELIKSTDRQKLILPDNMNAQQFKNLLNKLGRKKWNVKICEKYSHGEGILVYLARYLRGGPISGNRIIHFDDKSVTFNYGRKKRELMTLSLEKFISRFLQHVPRSHAILVRSYGIYSSSKKEQLDICREQLGQPKVTVNEPKSWQDYFPTDDKDPHLCPVCNKKLINTRTFIPKHKMDLADISPQHGTIVTQSPPG